MCGTISMSGQTVKPDARFEAPAYLRDPAFDTIKHRAFIDPVGKVAWQRDDAPRAVEILSDAGYAITRVELWCLCWDETYCHVIPYIDDQAGMHQAFLEEMWAIETEDWQTFCKRAGLWAMQQIPSSDYESQLTPEYGPEKMRIHLDVLSREEYIRE